MSAAITEQRVVSFPLTAKVESGTSQLIETIEAKWRTLCLEGPCNQPFFRPESIKVYLDAFASSAELILITVWRGSSLRAVLPLLKENRTLPGLSITVLRSAVNVHSSRFDLIHGLDDQSEAAKLVWRTLEDLPGWDLLEVSDVPPNGGFHSVYLAARKNGYRTALVPALSMPRINFDTEALVGEIAQYKSFRKRLPAKLKKLESQGEVSFRRIDCASRELLDSFYNLEGGGWKGQQGTAISCHSSTRHFYDKLAEAASLHKYFSMYTLELDGSPIAMHYGLTLGYTYYAPKVAYDESYKAFSPGQLLVMKVIQDCKLRKLRKYELLGTVSEWKKVWANELVEQKSYFVFSRSLRARASYLFMVLLPSLGRKAKRNVAIKMFVPKIRQLAARLRSRSVLK